MGTLPYFTCSSMDVETTQKIGSYDVGTYTNKKISVENKTKEPFNSDTGEYKSIS